MNPQNLLVPLQHTKVLPPYQEIGMEKEVS